MLARWSGWGALPAVFDPNAAMFEQLAWARNQLHELLTAEEYASAERSTINAHYTDAAYVAAIWDAVHQLGFDGGSVLEPGCGSGNFIAFAPERAELVGVELDPTTVALTSAIYPHAQIRAESFAQSRFAEATFDVVVGNMPFGEITLHDRRHNPNNHRIHNHFLIKSLHLTRPGGLVVAITSRYTMDAENPAARREIAELADLVGAARLPSGAHRRAAGTDVVTDVLVLRRREADRERGGFAFERSVPMEFADAAEPLRVNEYFHKYPTHVLGAMFAARGELGRPELGVSGTTDAGDAVVAALSDIVDRGRAANLVLADRGPHLVHPLARTGSPTQQADGYLALKGDGTFTRVEHGTEVPYEPPTRQARELSALLELRDTSVSLLEMEACSNDVSPSLDALRHELNTRYDSYVASFGPINRFSHRRTGRVDPETSEEKLARIRPPQGGFRDDPFSNVVYALEHFESSTQTATKAAIFHERVIARPVLRLGADTPADALAICLDTVGEVRLPDVARLLGVDEVEARGQLGVLVFDDPTSNRLVPAAEYLSGNVREKLATALAAQTEDPKFATNVSALTAVVPRELGPEEIHAQMGAAWIDAKHVETYLREILDDRTVQVEHPGGALWVVRSAHPGSVQSTSRWGTERCSAVTLAQALLEQRPIRIYDENTAGERVFNETATIAAVEKATEMSERFSEWVWENPERAAKLAHTYNEKFNAIVPRSYDGATLSLPGLALNFKPLPHQVAAVARTIHEPTVGLFHEVGAGKTAEIVMGAMELRRLGFVSKPVVVVPNHMLEQFNREWLQLYPQAKLLAASTEDLERDRRRLFVAKCATGDWDAVVMTRSAFERVPMSPAAQKEYLDREVEGIESMLRRASSANARFSIKRLQRMKLQSEERIKQKLDGVKDAGITFEKLGIDYIFVDEAHGYKNLRTQSNIPTMAVDGSQRASDLHMKIEYLRQHRARVATLATATPIANSMSEVYTMQRYLRPDLLEAAGITDFDQWAATFGQTTTNIEVTVDGASMRMQTRFAKFRNVPELLLLWQVSADIKTAEDLKLPVPAIACRAADNMRAPETVVVAPSMTLKRFVSELAQRADDVRARRVDPSTDNLLKISSDGRMAGLDLRLVGQETSEPQKVDVASNRIAAIYAQHRTDQFHGADGTVHARPGALQLVFADSGTPKPDSWNVYDELRAKLVAQGLPHDAVRFMHEARNDREKAELFAACRDGRIAVLVGSTERMGVGTNVQLRAVALHHLDCPWRPADITQREGRILRQGNANAEVQILRHVTEGSFDAYSWQTVSRKAQFIAQVMRGRLDVREIEDIGDAALSYSEVKALAAGNPLLLEHARAQAEVNRCERLQRSHVRSQELLRWRLQSTGQSRVGLEQRLDAADRAMQVSSEAPRDTAFRIVVRGRVYPGRPEANDALRCAVLEFAAASKATSENAPTKIGDLHGFAITATPHWFSKGAVVSLQGVPDSEIALTVDEIHKASIVTRLENRISNLPQLREQTLHEMKRLAVETVRAQTELTRPSRHVEQLETARAHFRNVDRRLSEFNERKTHSYTSDAESDAPKDRQGVAAIAVSRSKEERKQNLEEHWGALVARETERVHARAIALEAHLQTRAREVDSRVERVGVGATPGRSADGSAAEVPASTAEQLLPSQQHDPQHAIERKLDAVRAYAREPVDGPRPKCTELAVRLLEKREPVLALRVKQHRNEASLEIRPRRVEPPELSR